jgi:hypothetical protein
MGLNAIAVFLKFSGQPRLLILFATKMSRSKLAPAETSLTQLQRFKTGIATAQELKLTLLRLSSSTLVNVNVMHTGADAVSIRHTLTSKFQPTNARLQTRMRPAHALTSL